MWILSASQIYQRLAWKQERLPLHAEKEKHKSYGFLGNSYHFVPVAVETSGTFGPEAKSFSAI